MRGITVGFIILFLLTTCSPTEKKSDSGKTIVSNDSIATAMISQLLNQQCKDWNSGNVEAFMRGYHASKDLKFITKRGVMSGYDSITARYKRAYPNKEKMGHLEFNNIVYTRIANEPEIFQVTGNWIISGKDGSSGNFSLLIKRIGDDWRIIVDHTW